MVAPLIILLAFLALAESQKINRRDPEIENIVDAIDRARLVETTEILDSFGTRNTMSTQDSETEGVGAAYRWLYGRMSESVDDSPALPDGSRALRVEFDRFFQQNLGVDIVNVIGILEGRATGTRAACSVMISAHYDSRPTDRNDPSSYSPGADDDGSGVSVVLEALRVMSHTQFECTLYFVAFGAEEQGLYGATHLAEVFANRSEPLYAMLNNDIVGSSGPSSGTEKYDASRIRVFSRWGSPQQGENDGPARAVARAFREIGMRYVDYLEPVMIFRNDRWLRGGDHRPFGDRGYGAVRITETNENYDRQHQDVRVENGTQYGDLPEFLDFSYLTKVAGLNIATACVLSKAPRPPANARLLAQALENDSTIVWEHPPGKTPAGYYLVHRPTFSFEWETKIFVPYPQTQITLSLSKDNVFFGVQSVDEDGNESLVVFVSV